MRSAYMKRSLAIVLVFAAGLCADLARADEKPKAATKQDAAKKQEASKLQADTKKQEDAQLDMMAAQYVQQMRPMLRAELNFIRQICDLKPAQRPKIKAAGEDALKAAAKSFVEKNLRRGIRGMAWGGNSKPSNSRAEIAAALAGPLEQAIGQQAMARYSADRAKWMENRKRAAILSVVSRVDTVVLLSTGQREKIIEAISSKWQPTWESWLTFHSYDVSYFPHELDPLVAPLLNSDQQSIWRTTPKIGMGFWTSFVADDGSGADAWWDGEPAKTAADKK